MARNGSGTFSRIVPAYVFDTVISETSLNAEADDVASALTASIAKDGQTVPTANLPMGTYRHSGVGNGSARTDYAALGQVQDGSANWVDGGGTADVITATYLPVITALVDGQLCFVRATLANATTTPTFSPSGLTARTIVKTGGVALVAGDIVGDGHQLILRYDLAGTQWELLNPAVAAASTTVAGIVELATTAETTTGTDATRAVTPDGLHDMTSLAGAAWFLDEDAMGSDSATQVPSQQSVKAYVDASAGGITRGTLQATTSGTSVDYTGLPAGLDRITVMIANVSVSGTDQLLLQIGDSGGLETTSYEAAGGSDVNTAAGSTSGFLIYNEANAARDVTGAITLTRMDGNTWVATYVLKSSANNRTFWGAGQKTLSAELDRLSLLPAGANTFDLGSINVVYE